MATRKSELVITCNAQGVQNIMNFLNQRIGEIKQKMQQLNAQGNQSGWTQEMKKSFRELSKEAAGIDTIIKRDTEDLRKYSEVMNDLAGSKTKELKKALGEVKRALDNMSANDPKRKQLVKDLKKIQSQIEANTGAIKRQQSAFGALGTTMKNLFAYAGIFAGFNMLKSKMMEAYEANKKFSDSMANVRKVSGLAMDDIKQLANNLSQVDSRTSLEGLMELGYTGAKLGFGNYGIEGLEAFAKSAVKVQNALSEDMGADSMTALSKLVEVMGLIPKMGVERAMDAAGSAIFKLASTSTATGTNIIEFTKRLMGLANVSHVTTAELLALGSASDSMGLMAEVSATAFNKVFTSIQSNTKGIENALKMQQGELTNLVNQGKTMDAIVAVFEKMHGMSMDQLKNEGVFKALGSDGARLNNVMITMSNRIDMLKTHLQTSNQAFEEGTAVAQEYAIQMDTAAAYSERAANIWNKAFVNPQGVDTVKEFTKAWYEVSKSMTGNKAVMGEIKFLLTGILELMKAIVYLLPSILMGLSTIAGYRVGAAIATGLAPGIEAIKGMTMSVAALRTGFMALSTVARANIIGAAVTAVFALVSVVGMLNNKLKEASGYMKGFKNDLSDLNMEYTKGEAEVRRYRRAIDEANVGTKQRSAAIAQFNNKFKPYLSNLLTEKSTALDVAKAYGEVCKQMRTKLALQLKEKDISDQVVPREQWTAQRREEYNKLAGEAGMGQYGAAWITGYAQDNKSKSVDALIKDIGQQYYNLPQQVLNEVAKQAAAGAREFNNYGNIINSKYLKKANALLAAGSYLRQDRASENALRRVNKKWEPEQKAMDDYLASQNQEEPVVPIDETRLSKEEMKELTKAQQEEKKRMRKELEDAEKDSTAVINAIEEFYRLQESAIEQLVADGKMTRSEADRTIDYIRNRKDRMLLEARRAITGNENNFENLRKDMDKDLLRPDDTASVRAKETVQSVDVKAAAAKLKNFDGGQNVYGLDSGSFTQSVLKNAAQNELNIQRRQAKMTEEIDKIVQQYQFVEQAQKSFGDKLVKLGLITEGYDKVVQQLAEGTDIVANTKDVQALAQKMTGMDTRIFNVDTGDAYELSNAIDYLMTTVDADGNRIRESFASMFPSLDEWMENPEAYQKEMAAFYQVLIDYDKDYYSAIKQSYNQQKKDFDERWEISGKGQVYSNVTQEIGFQQREQKMTGADQGTNFAQMAGFAQIGQDPEVQMSLVRMAQMQEELEMYKEVNAQKEMSDAEREAFMQGVHEREMALRESEKAMQEAVMANINEQINKMNQWTEPIQQFSMDVGDALGKTLSEGESFSEGMRNALKSLVQSWGQSTIQIVKDLMMQQLKQKVIGKMMVKQEKKTQGEISDTDEESGKERLNATNIVETGMASVMQTMGNQMLQQKQAQDSTQAGMDASRVTGETMMGIAGAAARIMETLGPWGAPLIAVVTALLMGLLSMALGALGGGKKESTSTKATPKLKMVSGMLTYDEGNVGLLAGRRKLYDDGTVQVYDRPSPFVGQDGHVYMATQRGSIPDGVSLVRKPIATTVNGEPALVGEKGPEIVIGRKTTERIMMNEPALLHRLISLENGRRGMRTFDDGNLSDIAMSGTVSAGDRQGERDAALLEALSQNAAIISALQSELAKGIKATVNMYGSGGLDESMTKRDNFRRRYQK